MIRDSAKIASVQQRMANLEAGKEAAALVLALCNGTV